MNVQTLRRACYLALFFLSFTACGEEDASPTPEETPTEMPEMAVIATVDSSYSVGALATVSLEGWVVKDNLAAISGDSVVVSDEGRIFQLNRSSWNTLRVYEGGNFSAPTLEFSVGEGANPQDVALCGGELYVSLYESDKINVYDPTTGTLRGQVDLSAFADADGLPEAGSLSRVGERLYVALEQLDRSDPTIWTSAGGTLAEIDCSSKQVEASWSVGPSPNLFEDPGDEGQLWIRTGVFYGTDGSLAMDGTLRRFDALTQTLHAPVLEEAILGETLGPVAVWQGHRGVLLTTDSAFQSALYCFDAETGELEELLRTSSYLAGIWPNARGEAFVAAQTGWADPEAGSGLLVYDLTQCESLTGAEWIKTALYPSSVAFF